MSWLSSKKIGLTVPANEMIYSYLEYLKKRTQKTPLQIFFKDVKFNSVEFQSSLEVLAKKFEEIHDKISYLIIHAPVTCCLGSEKGKTRGFSKFLGYKVLDIAKRIQANGVVFHPGSNTSLVEGQLHVMKSLQDLSIAFNRAEVDMLIENMAGQRNCLLYSPSHLQRIKKSVHDIKFCIDTAHTFESGVNLKEYERFLEFVQEIEPENIGCFHANDSKTSCGSRNDRHEILGEGYIGIDFFKILLESKDFGKKPFIVEADRKELGWIASFEKGLKNLEAETVEGKKRKESLLDY